MQATEAAPNTTEPTEPTDPTLLKAGDYVWIWTDASFTRKRLYRVKGIPGQDLNYIRRSQ
jgi:hypothetical protein